jgi:hypothetical protein
VQQNVGGRGLNVYFNITTATSASAVLTIYGVDGASGGRYVLLTGAAKTTAVATPMFIALGATVTANVGANFQLPPLWQVEVVCTATTALTATVGAAVTL